MEAVDNRHRRICFVFDEEDGVNRYTRMQFQLQTDRASSGVPLHVTGRAIRLQMPRRGLLFLAGFTASLLIQSLQSQTFFNPSKPGAMEARDVTGNGPVFQFKADQGWQVGRSESDARTELLSPVMRVVSDQGVTIRVEHIYTFEGDFDGGQIKVIMNGHPSEMVVEEWSDGGYEGSNVDGLRGPGWTGTRTAPVTSVATLADVEKGDEVQLRFVAGWDDSIAQPDPNWTIRSFHVTGVMTGSPPPVQIGIDRMNDGTIWLEFPKYDGNRYFLQRLSGHLEQWEWTGFYSPDRLPGSVNPVSDGATGFFRAISVASGDHTANLAVLPINDTESEVAIYNAPPETAYVLESSVNGVDWSEVASGTTSDGENQGVARVEMAHPLPAHLRVVFDVHEAPAGFVFIPPGTFAMGDSLSEGVGNELPVHEVYVTGFYIQATEVTNDQMCDILNWAHDKEKLLVDKTTVKAAVGDRRELLNLDDRDCRIEWDTLSSKFVVKSEKGSGYPCVEVSWYGAAAYCNYLSEIEGREPCYLMGSTGVWVCDFGASGYRLPTEAEWEKAARGGTTGLRFPWGNTIGHDKANYVAGSFYPYDVSSSVGMHPVYNVEPSPLTAPVRSFSANGYGLFEVIGNVVEWCNDAWAWGYYSRSPSSDPTGPTVTTVTNRVTRGGGWIISALDCRVAARSADHPNNGSHSRGFRVVRR